jgi:hypothetical protein
MWMVSILASYGAALLLEHLAQLHVDIVITAVVIAATLARTQRGADAADRLIGLGVLAVSAAAASETGSLLVRYPVVGDAVFTCAVAATIWIRRFGSRATKAGTVMVVPFVALLVTYVQGASAYGAGHDLWSAVVAVIAGCAVAAVRWGGHRRPAPGRAAAGRSKASTRMAAQMAAALALAFAAGHLWFPVHWTWIVLTAFIVCSGARGRGDVVHKGVLRAAGAAVGTIVATWIAGSFPPDDAVSVVIIFAVLGVAIWLRQFSYAYWAGCVTAVLSLLYGYFGENAAPLLRTRLEEIAIGAAVGIAASWFVVPVRTSDVLRRRLADVLAALSDVLASRGDVTVFSDIVGQLELLSPALRAQRRLGHRQGADVIDAVRELVPAVRELSFAAEPGGELRSAVAGNVGAVRRALGGRAGKPYRPVPAGLPDSDGAVALRAIDGVLGTLDGIYAAPRLPTAGHIRYVASDGGGRANDP